MRVLAHLLRASFSHCTLLGTYGDSIACTTGSSTIEARKEHQIRHEGGSGRVAGGVFFLSKRFDSDTARCSADANPLCGDAERAIYDGTTRITLTAEQKSDLNGANES